MLSRPISSLTYLTVCTVALGTGAHAATVLTGSGLASNTLIPSTHGSNAPGTPDIALVWSATAGGSGASNRWEAYTGWPGGGAGGEVYQINGPTPWSGQTYNVDFTPASGTVAVQLLAFDLNDWVGATPATTTVDWTVSGSVSGLLAQGTGVVVADGSVLNIAPNVTGVGGETVRLSIAPTAGVGSYFALDNLSFDQVTVPEPGSAALGALALGAMAMRRRRQRA